MNPNKDGVYDKNDQKPVTGPDLRNLETGAQTGTSASGNNGDNFKFNKDGDKNGNTGSDSGNFNFNKQGDEGSGGGAVGAGKLAAKELGVGGGAVGAAATFAGGAKNFFLGSTARKRGTIFGGVSATLVGGGIFTLVILSGPGQLVQLSQVLQKNFTNINNASSVRSNSLLSSAGAQDIGETRVGLIQRQYLRSALGKLSEIGIDFQTNSLGNLRGATIDTDKLAHKFPELDGMSTSERRSWLVDHYDGVYAPDQFVFRGGQTFSIDATDFSSQSLKLLSDRSYDLAANGAVDGALNKRLLGKFFDIVSLWHPIKKPVTDKTRGLVNGIDDNKKAFQEQEAENRAQVEAPADPKLADAKSKASSYTGAASNVLLFTGGVCLVKSIAGDIVTINRDVVALPAAAEASSFIAVGEQIKSGQDISAGQVGGIEESLKDAQGQNVWQGQALQATEGVKNPSGPDIPSSYKAAFSPDVTVNSIESWANDAVGGKPIADTVCSPGGLILQVAGSVALGAASIISEIGTGFADTPAVVGAWAGKESLSFAVSAVGLHYIQQFILSKTTTGKLANDAFSGPLGGNLLAYGAREAANVGAISEGGIALANSTSSALAEQNQRIDQQQFRSQSFADRTFNINDRRTLAGKLADSISPSYGTNVASAVHGFGDMGGNLLSNLASIFIPKSQAAANQYDWGFPEYSIPPSLLNDSELSSPIDNANKVATYLDSGDAKGFKDKVHTCFGDTISKDSGVWDVSHDEDPNPADQTYIDAHCNNLSDPDWKRMIMFVFDTSTAQAMACTLGDNQSCSAVGLNTGGASATPTAPTTAASATIDMAHLYDSSVDVACAQGTNDIGVYDGYTGGNKVKIRLCAIPGLPSSGEEANGGYGVTGANGNCPLNSRVSGAVLAMVQAAKQDGVNLTTDSCFRTMAHQQALWVQDGEDTSVVAAPGTSNHQMGLAIDFSVPMCDTSINGQCSDPGNSMWDWASKNASNFGYKSGVPTEAWHWSPTGN